LSFELEMLTGDPLPREFAEAFAAAGGRLWPLAQRIIFFDTIGSTNDVALALAPDMREGTVVIADEQTAGRGRYGRTWFSPPRTGLYVSIVITPSAVGAAAERARGLLTLAAGVALAEGIETAVGIRADIKWPNDLLVGPRKVAGILAETVASAGGISVETTPVVLGYGINVGAKSYPGELRDRATSLELELGRPVDRANLCTHALVAISRRCQDLRAGRFDAILDAWRAKAPASHGAHVSWSTPTGARSGVTTGIDDQGALLVRVGDQVERIVGGALIWN
jgi:BirA family biotin operon repressor/biotin-[acetyl-CoA-carboxylase] ligase